MREYSEKIRMWDILQDNWLGLFKKYNNFFKRSGGGYCGIKETKKS